MKEVEKVSLGGYAFTMEQDASELAAGYLGLFSLIPFVGVLALILGIIAIVDINKHPEKHGLGRAWFGAIMGGLSTLFYLFVFCSAGLK